MTGKEIVNKKESIRFIKSNFYRMSNGQMAEALGVYIQAVREKCYQLGLYRMRLDYWTKEQIRFLKANYKKIGDKELAILFNSKWKKEKGWTFKHIEKKRLYLKLKRTAAQLQKIKMRNIERGAWLNTTTWKTRGEAEDGTVRIWHNITSGRWPFKVIKIDGSWVHYAHWLYKFTYGEFPPGCVVGFKDRNNMNVVPENLEAITRAEHAGRNSTKYTDELRLAEKTLDRLNKLIKSKIV